MPSSSRRPRRPKPGTGFLLVRLIGWFLKIIGGLLIATALINFIVMLVKTGSMLIETLIGAFHFPEQKMAGFIALTILGGLLAFVLLGLLGIILAGVGFALARWGTAPAAPAVPA
jgi:hypothetical protein